MTSLRAARRRALVLLLVLCAALGASACRGEHPLPRLPMPGRAAPAAVRTLVELRLGTMPEEHEGRRLGGNEPTFDDVLAELDATAEQASRTGLFVRLGALGGGSARAEELVAALARVRAAHKPVHCHFEIADNLGFLVAATGCDRVTMTPAGHLALVGTAAHLFSFRGLLEWAGIGVDAVQAGDAKGAADPFLRDEPTPEHRENVQRLVDALHARLVAAVVRRTGRDENGARSLIAEGPFTSRTARAAGLVDDVEYDDEAREHARTACGASRVERALLGPPPPDGIGELLERLTASDADVAPEGPHVVVARLSGSIVDADRPVSGSTAGEPFVRAMRRFAHADDVRALVLRIDSPGGSALASDRMWHAVRLLARRKPVVVSIGDMAASGGYYVACAGTEIFASESSIVGSIGVVAGRPDLSPFLQRFGVRTFAVVGAPSADLFTPFRRLRDDERARFEASAAETYGRFLSRIEESRGLSHDRVLAAAEGRIFPGAEAQSLGLVTRIGGLSDALARARALAHLSADAPRVDYPPRRSFLEALFGDGGAEAHAPLAALAGVDPARLASWLAAASAVEGDGLPRAALPYVLEIR